MKVYFAYSASRNIRCLLSISLRSFPTSSDGTRQAPLPELNQGSDEGLNRQKFSFRTPIEANFKGNKLTGLTYFDLEPEFPCFALMLGV
jgi:hypothetical protein